MIRILFIISFIILNSSNAFSQCGKHIITRYDKFNKTTSYNGTYDVERIFEWGNIYSATRLTMDIHAVGSNYYDLTFTIKKKNDKNKSWEDFDIINFKANPNSYIQFLFVDGTTHRIRNSDEMVKFWLKLTLWLKGSVKETTQLNDFLIKLKTVKIEAIRLSVDQNYDFDLTPQNQQDFIDIFNCLPY